MNTCDFALEAQPNETQPFEVCGKPAKLFYVVRSLNPTILYASRCARHPVNMSSVDMISEAEYNVALIMES